MNSKTPGGAIGLKLVTAPSGLGFRTAVVAEITSAPVPGALAFPRAVYIAEDGRALAWFGDGRPCVVHPSFAELCRMHGVEGEATLAA